MWRAGWVWGQEFGFVRMGKQQGREPRIKCGLMVTQAAAVVSFPQPPHQPRIRMCV